MISNLRLSAMSRQVDAQLVTESIDKLEEIIKGGFRGVSRVVLYPCRALVGLLEKNRQHKV